MMGRPRLTQAIPADEHHGAPDRLDDSLQRIQPGPAWNEFPFVQPYL